MANNFSKEEKVAFDQMLQGFEDGLVASSLVSVKQLDPVMMERANDTIWRPQPYIAQSFDGVDQSSNFTNVTQLSVPATFGYQKSVPVSFSGRDLLDGLREGTIGDSAKQKLASDINYAILNVASTYGTLFVKRTSAATGYDDLAECDAIMNEQGIQMNDRVAVLSTRDYNAMASNLASRQTVAGKVQTAYEKSYVGDVAGFSTHKLDYAISKTAKAASSITISTADAGANYYTPKATSTAATGEVSNVDNRFQTVTVSSTTNIAAGDAFTIANVYAVHHITKQSTGQLKTFRVISVTDSTHMVISPPIISNQVAAAASAAYQNCTVTSKSATAAITFLNTVDGRINPFWVKGAIELLPAKVGVPNVSDLNILRASTSNGIEVTLTRQGSINDLSAKYRWDARWGIAALQPEMMGLMMFSQT